MGRADAALELVLTDDAERAAEVADELDHANAERRLVETRILFAAEAQAREAGERTAYVLAGEDWHPGVVGIVAARIAERHHRPTVLVAMDGDRGTGSGRSIPAFDLLAGLHAGAEHLERHGGHRAAAGLEIRADALDAFRAAFERHAAAVLAPEDLVPLERVDAVVPGDVLGLGLAEELERIEPCGAGNPGATLLVRAATFSDPVGMGEDKHVRFSVTAGGARSRAVAFGNGARLPVPAGVPVDATFRLECNEWGGTTEPRLVLRSARPCAPEPIEVLEPADPVEAELAAPLDPPGHRPAGARAVVDRRGSGIAGVVADLVATGEPVLVVVADTPRRLRRAAGTPRRLRPRLAPRPRAGAGAGRTRHPRRVRRPARARAAGGRGRQRLPPTSPTWRGGTLRSRSRVRRTHRALGRAPGRGGAVPGAARRPATNAVAQDALTRSRAARARPSSRSCGSPRARNSSPAGARTRSRAAAFRAYHVRYEDGSAIPDQRDSTSGLKAKASRSKDGKSSDGAKGNGAQDPREREPPQRRRPVDTVEHEVVTLVARADLTDLERQLLSDLFAIVEEHADEVARAGRPRAGREVVRVRLRAPRRPAPQVGRGLHRPPGRRGQDLRRHAPRHRDAVRRAAARHRRGHHRVAGRGARERSATRSPAWSTA